MSHHEPLVTVIPHSPTWFRTTFDLIEGLPGVLGNKGTLAKYRGEQGNMNPFLGNRGTKLYKLEDENMVSKFIERGANKENMWEHGNIRQFWKGTREQGPPMGNPPYSPLTFGVLTTHHKRLLRL